MQWKTVGIICGIILFMGVVAAVYKIIQKTEGYKTMGNSYYYTNEPHFGWMSFGCNRYILPSEKVKSIQPMPVEKIKNITKELKPVQPMKK